MQPKYAKYCHMGSKYERKHRGICMYISMGGLFSGVPHIETAKRHGYRHLLTGHKNVIELTVPSNENLANALCQEKNVVSLLYQDS